MRTTWIRMSDPALAHLAGMLGLSGKWFLPECTGDAKGFLAARREWEKIGVASLDFDGELHLKPRAARMIYNMTHARAAALCQSGEQKTLLLRGPVDVLALVYEPSAGNWAMALRPFHETAYWLRSLSKEVSGSFVMLREKDGTPEQESLENSLADFFTQTGEQPAPGAFKEKAQEKEGKEDAGNGDSNDSV